MRLCVRSIRARVVPNTPRGDPLSRQVQHHRRVTGRGWSSTARRSDGPLSSTRAAAAARSPPGCAFPRRAGRRRVRAQVHGDGRHRAPPSGTSPSRRLLRTGREQVDEQWPLLPSSFRPFRRRRRRLLLFHPLAFHPRATDRADLTLRQLPGQRRDVRGPGAGGARRRVTVS